MNNLTTSKRILNLGCGDDVYGTDFIDLYPQRKEVRKIDLNEDPKLPYKANTFSEIKFYGLIEYLVYPQEVLSECHRTLKAKGLLSLRTFDITSLRFKIKPLKDRYADGNMWSRERRYNLLDKHTLTNRLGYAGFNIESIRNVTKVFPNDFILVNATKKPNAHWKMRIKEV